MPSELEGRLADLLAGDAEDPATGEDWTALLAQVGRARRVHDDAGLARGEFADQLHVHQDDEALAAAAPQVQLAAAESSGPGEWSSGDYTLHVAPHPEGGWHVLLQGPRAAILAERALVPGVWVRVDRVPEPPVLTLEDGSHLALSR